MSTVILATLTIILIGGIAAAATQIVTHLQGVKSFEVLENELRATRKEHNLRLQNEFSKEFKQVTRVFEEECFLQPFSEKSIISFTLQYDKLAFVSSNKEYLFALPNAIQKAIDTKLEFNDSNIEKCYKMLQNLCLKYKDEFIAE